MTTKKKVPKKQQHSMNWLCSICQKSADYHLAKEGKHIYYCEEHWTSEFLRFRK